MSHTNTNTLDHGKPTGESVDEKGKKMGGHFSTKLCNRTVASVVIIFMVVFFLIITSDTKSFYKNLPFPIDDSTRTLKDLLTNKYEGPVIRRKVLGSYMRMEYPLILESVNTFQTLILDQLPFVSRADNSCNNYDRVMTQIDVMKILNRTLSKQINLKPKVVYMNHKDDWKHIDFNKCVVTNCIKTLNLSEAKEADAILFKNSGFMPIEPKLKRSNQNQVWMMWIDESSTRSWDMNKYHDWFNWTLTYRHDAVITTPYFRFNLSKPDIKIKASNFASGRKKKIAWFVSNCYTTKSGRQDYVKELSKHIDVDIYGSCGNKKCKENCVKLLEKNYKFYLAFENHRCHEYITEKVERPFKANVLPIVLGASKEEYARVLPDRSFIHVDDFDNPKDLAQYLHKLDKNDTLYNGYFKWKYTTTGLMDPVPWCRMCALLNQPNIRRIWYDTLDKHWRTDKCIRRQSWKNVTSYEKLFIGQPNYVSNV